MTLDEAILHAEEVAYRCAVTDGNIRCENEHRQLAEWLKDYKRLLEQQPTVTSTNNSGDIIYPQVEGITPIVVNEDIYECSCGFGWDRNKTSRFHFCPNCGKAVGDGNDYKYIKSISKPTGIEFDIDIPKKVESYGKLLKHPVVKHVMGMDEEQEQLKSNSEISNKSEIRYNQGFFDGYKEATEQANKCIEKIKSDLHDATFRYTVAKERNARGKVEWSDFLLNSEEVFYIIDKYTKGGEADG